MAEGLTVALIGLGTFVAMLLVWLLAFPFMAAAERRDKVERDAAWLAKVDEWNRPAHSHGAWCHPSAEGCPERPGA